jgi:hypothetical protein
VTTIREAMAPLDGAGIQIRPASAAEHGPLATIQRDPSDADWWQVADVDADVAELLGDP